MPAKFLLGWLGKKPKITKTEREKKQLAHVRNFAPTHYSWPQRIGKPSKKKKQTRNKKIYLVKK